MPRRRKKKKYHTHYKKNNKSITPLYNSMEYEECEERNWCANDCRVCAEKDLDDLFWKLDVPTRPLIMFYSIRMYEGRHTHYKMLKSRNLCDAVKEVLYTFVDDCYVEVFASSKDLGVRLTRAESIDYYIIREESEGTDIDKLRRKLRTRKATPASIRHYTSSVLPKIKDVIDY